MMNSIENATHFTDLAIKGGILICNFLAYLLLDVSSSLDLIDKGGVIALLLLITYVLFKMVQTKDKTIKSNYEKMLDDKDDQIQKLQDELNRKK